MNRHNKITIIIIITVLTTIITRYSLLNKKQYVSNVYYNMSSNTYEITKLIELIHTNPTGEILEDELDRIEYEKYLWEQHKKDQQQLIKDSLANIEANPIDTGREERLVSSRNKNITKPQSKSNTQIKINQSIQATSFRITAYDLSYNSCQKEMSDPYYGITANGTSLRGLSREQAMTVAADTRVIPMGSKVYIDFTNPKYKIYNGIYTVRDRGGAIRGAKIDLFFGDFGKRETDQSVWNFGVTQAKVYIVK